MTAECTNDDKWNCKYCRKVKSCEANAVGITDRPPITDSERLEWLVRNVSGKELRRIGVTYGGNCGRDLIDVAMLKQNNHGVVSYQEESRMVFEPVSADEYNGEA